MLILGLTNQNILVIDINIQAAWTKVGSRVFFFFFLGKLVKKKKKLRGKWKRKVDRKKEKKTSFVSFPLLSADQEVCSIIYPTDMTTWKSLGDY